MYWPQVGEEAEVYSEVWQSGCALCDLGEQLKVRSYESRGETGGFAQRADHQALTQRETLWACSASLAGLCCFVSFGTRLIGTGRTAQQRIWNSSSIVQVAGGFSHIAMPGLMRGVSGNSRYEMSMTEQVGYKHWSHGGPKRNHCTLTKMSAESRRRTPRTRGRPSISSILK